MENATKALVMAGGILISIMVIATLLYAATTWGIIPTTEDKTDEAKQLAKFNQEYESYYRDALYGTDLVSVLNKAIDNNKRYDAKGVNDPMYVDIHFTLITDVNSIAITYKTYYTGEKKGETEQVGQGAVAMSLPAKEYKLCDDRRKIEEFINGFEDTTKRHNYTYGVDQFGKYRQYTEVKPDVSEFKTRIFRCIFGDPSEDGRIKNMTFLEVNTNRE